MRLASSLRTEKLAKALRGDDRLAVLVHEQSGGLGRSVDPCRVDRASGFGKDEARIAAGLPLKLAITIRRSPATGEKLSSSRRLGLGVLLRGALKVAQQVVQTGGDDLVPLVAEPHDLAVVPCRGPLFPDREVFGPGVELRVDRFAELGLDLRPVLLAAGDPAGDEQIDLRPRLPGP